MSIAQYEPCRGPRGRGEGEKGGGGNEFGLKQDQYPPWKGGVWGEMGVGGGKNEEERWGKKRDVGWISFFVGVMYVTRGQE